jgi:hypothetical protein
MMPFHVEKFDGKGIQRRQDIILGHKEGGGYIPLFPAGYQSQSLGEIFDPLLGEDEQKINIRYAGDVISPGAAPVKDDGNQFISKNALEVICDFRKNLFGFIGYLRHKITSD